jgi:hypothetical protein
MLTIRDQQFQMIAQELFESWMEEHLNEFFAEEISSLSAPEIGVRIRKALETARRYRFVTQSQWCRYVDLTFVLGPSFDEDPRLPWASEILRDARVTDPEMRIELLFAAAQDHMEQIEEQGLQPDEARGWE